MTTVNTKSGKIINVVSREEESKMLTLSDQEMDARAVEAVKAAINKARVCKKPIAGYDKENKKAYIEYANGAMVNIASYAQMAIRTANKRAYLQGEGEKRAEWGVHTVLVPNRGGGCPYCIKLQFQKQKKNY